MRHRLQELGPPLRPRRRSVAIIRPASTIAPAPAIRHDTRIRAPLAHPRRRLTLPNRFPLHGGRYLSDIMFFKPTLSMMASVSSRLSLPSSSSSACSSLAAYISRPPNLAFHASKARSKDRAAGAAPSLPRLPRPPSVCRWSALPKSFRFFCPSLHRAGHQPQMGEKARVT